MLFLLPTLAHATDLHAELTTIEGISQSFTWRTTETFNQRFGPVETKKKGSAVYVVSVTPSVFDPLENAYRVEFTMCVEWSRKSKSDRICQKDELLAPAEGNGKLQREWNLKGKDLFGWTLGLWYSGEPPIPAGLPAPEPEKTEE